MSRQLTFEAMVRGERILGPLERLRALFRPDRTDLLSVVAFSIVIGGLLLATPIAVQTLVGFVAFGGAGTPLLVLSLLLGCGLGLAAVLSGVQTWIVELLQRRLLVRTVADLADRLPRVDPRTQGQWYGPELVNRFFDIVTIQKMTSFLLLDGLGVALGVVIGMVVLAFYHPILLAFDLIIVLSVLAIIFGLGRSGVRTAIAESRSKYALAAWLEEIARNPLAFRGPRAGDQVVGRIDALTRDYLGARRSHYGVLFRQIIGTLALQVVASVALLGLGGWLVIRGELTLGQLVAAELIVTYVVGSVAKMGKHLEAFYDLTAASDKVGKLLEVPLEREGCEAWSDERAGAGSSVHAAGLRYTLPSGRILLDEVALDVEPGERVALTGGTGSGKTTVLEMIYGLRRFESGTLRVDGLDLRSVDLAALRERVALAGPVELFEGTLRENVTLGRTVSAEELYEALEMTGLLDDVLALPDGLDTQLNAHGWSLSRGQQRRLMVARAVAARPSLLLIDGLLDLLSESESEALLDRLLQHGAPWTLIVATRSPGVLRRFDRVVDLNATRAGAMEVTT